MKSGKSVRRYETNTRISPSATAPPFRGVLRANNRNRTQSRRETRPAFVLEQGVCCGSPGTRTQNQRIKSPMRCHCASDPGTRETRTSTPKIRSGMAVSVPTDETNCYLPVRSRCLHPGQQHGRRWPSSSSSWVRRMRRATSRFLLGILDPADELVAGQRRDVCPGIERRGVGDQRLTQIPRQLVHHATGNLLAAHGDHSNGRTRPATDVTTRRAPDPGPTRDRARTDSAGMSGRQRLVGAQVRPPRRRRAGCGSPATATSRVRR